jgi:hypothetical protein
VAQQSQTLKPSNLNHGANVVLEITAQELGINGV